MAPTATTFTADTGVSTSSSIWGVELEATTVASQTKTFFIPQLYYAPGGSSTWEVGLTVIPTQTAPPLNYHDIGYTIRYSYK